MGPIGDLTVELINDRQTYDRELCRFDSFKIQHTWGWGEARRILGWQPLRVLMKAGGFAVPFSVHVRIVPVIGRRIGLVPATPPGLNSETADLFIAALRRTAQEMGIGVVTVVVNSLKRDFPSLAACLADAGMTPSVLVRPHMKTVVVNVTAPQETLLALLSSGHRYYVRRARRLGVTVTLAKREDDMLAFYDIYYEMCVRKRLVPFPREWFRTLWRELGTIEQIRLFLVEHQGMILGGSVVACEPNGYILLFSAHRTTGVGDTGASRLLEWEIMMDAQNRGLTYYDLGGVSYEASAKRTQADGVAFWKLGFGGSLEEYVGCFDLVLDHVFFSLMKWVRAGTVYEKIKRLVRRRW